MCDEIIDFKWLANVATFYVSIKVFAAIALP